MEDLFKKLSEEVHGDYEVTYEKSYSPFIMSPLSRIENGVQIKSLALNIPYKGTAIEVIYKLSNDQVGVLSTKLEKGVALPEFQITNRSHFLRLLNKRLNILKVECGDNGFKTFLTKQLWDLKLEELARNVQFEPAIKGSIKSGYYELETTYHLAFPDKKTVLPMMIALYKALINKATI